MNEKLRDFSRLGAGLTFFILTMVVLWPRPDFEWDIGALGSAAIAGGAWLYLELNAILSKSEKALAKQSSDREFLAQIRRIVTDDALNSLKHQDLRSAVPYAEFEWLLELDSLFQIHKRFFNRRIKQKFNDISRNTRQFRANYFNYVVSNGDMLLPVHKERYLAEEDYERSMIEGSKLNSEATALYQEWNTFVEVAEERLIG